MNTCLFLPRCRLRRVGPGALLGLVAGLVVALAQDAAPATPAAVPAPPPVRKPRLLSHEEMPALQGEGWKSLFDGRNLKPWTVTDFAGHGDVEVADGNLVLGMGAIMSGVNGPTNLFKTNYELVLDAKRTMGSDFFCGLTFPVGNDCCSLIIGGWGGGVVGLSSLDDMDASMNETTLYLVLKQDQWYRVRVRVTLERIDAWIGERQVAEVRIEDHKITVRPGDIELSQPFGIATYQTAAAIRNIQWRSLD